jgi:filamentous hemagglutinin
MIDISQRFFHYLAGARFGVYTPPKTRKLFAQSHGGSCVAAAVRMFINDHDYDQPEAYIRGACKVDALDGGHIADVPQGLRDLEFPRATRYDANMALAELRYHVGSNPAIVGLKLEKYGSHALVVDEFAGDTVRLRDPLPVGAGSTYSVQLGDFTQAWGGKAVVIA